MNDEHDKPRKPTSQTSTGSAPKRIELSDEARSALERTQLTDEARSAPERIQIPGELPLLGHGRNLYAEGAVRELRRIWEDLARLRKSKAPHLIVQTVRSRLDEFLGLLTRACESGTGTLERVDSMAAEFVDSLNALVSGLALRLVARDATDEGKLTLVSTGLSEAGVFAFAQPPQEVDGFAAQSEPTPRLPSLRTVGAEWSPEDAVASLARKLPSGQTLLEALLGRFLTPAVDASLHQVGGIDLDDKEEEVRTRHEPAPVFSALSELAGDLPSLSNIERISARLESVFELPEDRLAFVSCFAALLQAAGFVGLSAPNGCVAQLEFQLSAPAGFVLTWVEPETGQRKSTQPVLTLDSLPFALRAVRADEQMPASPSGFDDALQQTQGLRLRIRELEHQLRDLQIETPMSAEDLLSYEGREFEDADQADAFANLVRAVLERDGKALLCTEHDLPSTLVCARTSAKGQLRYSHLGVSKPSGCGGGSSVPPIRLAPRPESRRSRRK